MRNEKRNPISQLTYIKSDTKEKPDNKSSFGLLHWAGRGMGPWLQILGKQISIRMLLVMANS
jgi:hypothetical protein